MEPRLSLFKTFDQRDKNLYILTAFSNSPVFLKSKKYDYDTKLNLYLVVCYKFN